ncbi:MAG: cysteine desulfurase / selenocysteine lyase [Gaiellales bacterium]|nr:cysteine desulfurase / selenocysteine lyase [Gaiellales bacterium]
MVRANHHGLHDRGLTSIVQPSPVVAPDPGLGMPHSAYTAWVKTASADPSAPLSKALDAQALRADFPILAREINGYPLAYLDSAASAQTPRQVMDAMNHVYEHHYANVHRGVYTIAAEATDAYEGARDKIAAFLNARNRRECLFVRNATEGLNLVAYSYGNAHCGPGDVIVCSEMEHHSNMVPWQLLANRTGASIRYIGVTDDGRLDLDQLAEIEKVGRVKLVAVVHQSNTLGTLNPVSEICEWAHERDAVVVVDGAQSAPHRAVDVQALGCDFFAFSGHKLPGPSGAGALWGREELLRNMPPFMSGGEMIQSVELEKTSFNSLPWKFEAGTPAIVECVGLGAAVDYLEAVGMDAIAAHEAEITAYAHERLSAVDGLAILGPSLADRGGVISFTFEPAHPHDVAQILDRRAVCVRAGHHCTQPLMKRFGVPATTRASFYLYTVPEEIDRLCDGLEDVRGVFA